VPGAGRPEPEPQLGQPRLKVAVGNPRQPREVLVCGRGQEKSVRAAVVAFVFAPCGDDTGVVGFGGEGVNEAGVTVHVDLSGVSRCVAG
jgi:hypothetical protein